ncbi:MAG TPA: hypothetical protein DIC60_01425 [Lachnospiraceae bacterium]|nr:hypothetical protein [Lachnospiraceae bacterium]
MKSFLMPYFMVYLLVILFIGFIKKKSNGTKQRSTESFGGFGRSAQRERTTFNTTQSASKTMKPTTQRLTGKGFPIPIFVNNSFGMGKEHDDFITDEKKKYARPDFISKNDDRGIDCELDERIFGPKNQNKDVF